MYFETAQDLLFASDKEDEEDEVGECLCVGRCEMTTGVGASTSRLNHGTWGTGVVQISGRNVA